MKVGEAGEAFFVVETEEEVSDDLLTSPLLAATEVSLCYCVNQQLELVLSSGSMNVPN